MESIVDKLYDTWIPAFNNFRIPYDIELGLVQDGHEYYDSVDRLSEAPTFLGFLYPQKDKNYYNPQLTPAGKLYLSSHRKGEILLRQLLKHQLPSPYYTYKATDHGAVFWVKPYLELFRLIRHFGSVTFDELMLFGLQLTDYRKFEQVVAMIDAFRNDKLNHKGRYRQFLDEQTKQVISDIFETEIREGNTKTRETKDDSLKNFIATKKSNMRDYADSFFRHLRESGMVNISQSGHSVSIAPEKREEVDFILENVGRDPVFVSKEEEKEFVGYLVNPEFPKLLTDNQESLVKTIHAEFPLVEFDSSLDLNALKDLLDDLREKNKAQLIKQEIINLKDQKEYEDIVKVFNGIKKAEYYDNPLMLEWNTWRAMTMIDGGDIKANLNFDDFGKPLSTAAGNSADIVCDYGHFGVTVELTLSSGQRQFAMESEPVPRHLGRHKEDIGKQAYCLFVAPTINEATIAFFFGLHKTPIDFYGGDTIIVPLELKYFEKMLADSYKASYIPSPTNVENFFVHISNAADEFNGKDGWRLWYEEVKKIAQNWLDL